MTITAAYAEFEGDRTRERITRRRATGSWAARGRLGFAPTMAVSWWPTMPSRQPSRRRADQRDPWLACRELCARRPLARGQNQLDEFLHLWSAIGDDPFRALAPSPCGAFLLSRPRFPRVQNSIAVDEETRINRTCPTPLRFSCTRLAPSPWSSRSSGRALSFGPQSRNGDGPNRHLPMKAWHD